MRAIIPMFMNSIMKMEVKAVSIYSFLVCFLVNSAKLINTPEKKPFKKTAIVELKKPTTFFSIQSPCMSRQIIFLLGTTSSGSVPGGGLITVLRSNAYTNYHGSQICVCSLQ